MRPADPRSEAGFTLIELLTVMLIIGILAAIALPAFATQKSKAQDADAKAGLDMAQTTLELHRTNFDTYAATPEMLRREEPGLTSGAASTLEVDGDTSSYTLQVTSRSGTRFTVAGPAAQRLCNAPGRGGCTAAGRW